MKALALNSAAKKAARSEFEKNAKDFAEHTAQSVLALMAYLMFTKWKCSPATCRRRIRDISDMLSVADVCGKVIHDSDYINWCRDNINLDVTEEIKLKVSVEFV